LPSPAACRVSAVSGSRGYARRTILNLRAPCVDRSSRKVARWIRIARGALRASARVARVLVLPLALLLFLQWPLREWLHAWSREANDLAQILFALYVAVAVSDAMRRRAHLAADAFAHNFSARTRVLLVRVGAVLVLAPWCVFMLYASAPMVWSALLHGEAFAETLNPGYFLVKLAVALLVLLVFLQALVDIAAPASVETDD
jgi:TRAP-type mannitol/chloroaromatic compound transport system permease small subunit